MRQQMDDPEAGRVCLPSSPLRFTDAPALKPSPFLNQHEEELLGGIFGFSAEQRAALREAGAISTKAQVKGQALDINAPQKINPTRSLEAI